MVQRERSDVAHRQIVKIGESDAECEYAGSKSYGDGEGEAESDKDDNSLSLPLKQLLLLLKAMGRNELTPNLEVDGESVGKEWKEGINSPLPVVNSFLPLPEAESEGSYFLPSQEPESSAQAKLMPERV